MLYEKKPKVLSDFFSSEKNRNLSKRLQNFFTEKHSLKSYRILSES